MFNYAVIMPTGKQDQKSHLHCDYLPARVEKLHYARRPRGPRAPKFGAGDTALKFWVCFALKVVCFFAQNKDTITKLTLCSISLLTQRPMIPISEKKRRPRCAEFGAC